MADRTPVDDAAPAGAPSVGPGEGAGHEAAGGDLRTADGVRLAVRDWAPAPGTPRRGSALIVHGLGEHAGRYAHVAAVLARLGVAVRAYDQRGFGASSGARGAIPHADALLDDARLVFDALAGASRVAGDAAPPFLIGHSMGGAVAARAATGGWIAPRGLVLSSPALRTRATPLQRLAARVGSRIAPGLRVPHGLPLRYLSHDPAVLPAVRADPLCHDRITPRLARFIDDAGRAAVRDATRLAAPTLLLVAGDDRLVDPAGSVAFAAAMPPERVVLRAYDDLWHELLNERESDRGRVLADLGAWIEARLGDG